MDCQYNHVLFLLYRRCGTSRTALGAILTLDLFSHEKAGAKRDLFSRIWVFCSRCYEFRMLLLLRLPNLHWNLNKENTGNTFQFFEEKVIVPNVCLNWLEKNSGDKKEESSYIGLFIPIADAKISFCVWSICFPVETSLKKLLSRLLLILNVN